MAPHPRHHAQRQQRRYDVEARDGDIGRAHAEHREQAGLRPLLAACEVPLRTVWPEARHRTALSHVYLPGQYLTLVTRPGARYIVRGILQEDFAFWVLSTVGLAPHMATHVLGLLALLVSFWAIYEQGYVDNDRIAHRFEAAPRLTPEFHTSALSTAWWLPWTWVRPRSPASS